VKQVPGPTQESTIVAFCVLLDGCIAGAIRRSSPVIVGSLLLLLIALTLGIIGSTKNDFKIIVSAIVYIFSG